VGGGPTYAEKKIREDSSVRIGIRLPSSDEECFWYEGLKYRLMDRQPGGNGRMILGKLSAGGQKEPQFPKGKCSNRVKKGSTQRMQDGHTKQTEI